MEPDGQGRQGQVPQGIEPAHARPAQRKEPELDAEQEGQDDAHPERGDPDDAREHEPDGVVDGAFPPERRQRRERHGDDETDQGRVGDQGERDGDPLERQRRDLLLVEVRRAEVAARQVAEEVEVLAPDREVEPELVPHALDQLGRRPLAQDRDGRIARDETDQQEDDDADAEQDGHDRHHPPRRVANHPTVVAPMPAGAGLRAGRPRAGRGDRDRPEGPAGLAHFLVTSSKLYFPCEFGEKPTTAGVVA